ncbi:hypothetical protein TVAG_316150 [Trichomonas vaginalis G3]|uniref:Uncharacterized protein n=1 Tax=Trichomonas vaginalis (strain ATCC PRA-98 / G3) TaxID=412133 RepID=A2FAX3_TRIV3|nr:armadillo (ARM) repeat-containing protein family [Trichomonas vaginalis G3]EAX97950.1 hypothetical protein TVAG_316150 [Trichomonas vaginalis G3]KAI5502546.1 armadillo (ARM) repeat-containing protein family [Trichomonas vaginalis G3]|eukprot:XP_001310880.1 hypothetical protein [Trichomonas vaginalis G3]
MIPSKSNDPTNDLSISSNTNKDYKKFKMVDLNTEEMPLETQEQISNLLFSDNFNERAEAFDIFANYSQEHYPDGEIILKIQQAIEIQFQNDDINENILANIIRIVDSLGKYFNDNFDSCLYISKIWGLMPNIEIADSISKILCTHENAVVLILSDVLSPTIFNLLESDDSLHQTIAINLLRSIFQNSSISERANRYIPNIIELAKNSSNCTIIAQCFELFPEFLNIDPQIFLSEMFHDLFLNFESYNEADFLAAGRFIAEITEHIDICQFVENSKAIQMIIAALNNNDELAHSGAISSIFAIISSSYDGIVMIFNSPIANLLLHLKERTSNQIWKASLRILCVICVTLGSDVAYDFSKNDFANVLIENINSSMPTMYLEMLGALIKILNSLLAHNEAEMIKQILENETLYEELSYILDENTDPNVTKLAEYLIDFMNENLNSEN